MAPGGTVRQALDKTSPLRERGVTPSFIPMQFVLGGAFP